MSENHLITVSKKLVTPEWAEALRDTDGGVLRAGQSKVDRFAAEMVAGNFRLSRMDVYTDGQIIEGRHRCLAVMQAGISVEMIVVRWPAKGDYHRSDEQPQQLAQIGNFRFQFRVRPVRECMNDASRKQRLRKLEKEIRSGMEEVYYLLGS